MVVVTSRFRVVNGMHAEVREAFLHRPGLVDAAPGFLGMEVFTSPTDDALFYLVTRWTDFASYSAWHDGKGRRESIPFIPKGLKLDPAYTEVTRMERIDPLQALPPLDAQARDLAPVLAHALRYSRAFFHLTTDRHGVVRGVNRAFVDRLGSATEDIVGSVVVEWLTKPDADALLMALHEGRREPEQMRILNFVGRDHAPFSLRCHVDIQPTGLVVLGEEPRDANARTQSELLQMSNEMAVLMRDNQRKTRELEDAKRALERTLADLQESHWHLRKIQEFLPVCAYCKRIKFGEGDADWGDLLDFLSGHAEYFTHGLCPECFEEQMAQIEAETDGAR